MKSDATIKAVLASPVHSFWLKKALTEAINRDCVDAASDAMALAQLLTDRANEALDLPLSQITEIVHPGQHQRGAK